MSKIVLYIAMSLDGYIADTEGSVSWLVGDGSDPDSLGGDYDSFISSVDTVVMGYNTYDQITNQLSPNDWPYKKLESYVITKKKIKSIGNVHFTDEPPSSLIKKLREQSEKDVWICGGATIANALISDNQIDRYIISIIPTVLGNGIKLFSRFDDQQKLKLISTKNGNGIVELTYDRQK